MFFYHPTRTFENKLQKISRNDPQGFFRIKAVIERILRRPDNADGRMQVRHHARYKKYVGRKDYRIIYEWCEICRKANLKLAEKCAQCEQIADHSVVFFDVYHKNEMDKIG